MSWRQAEPALYCLFNHDKLITFSHPTLIIQPPFNVENKTTRHHSNHRFKNVSKLRDTAVCSTTELQNFHPSFQPLYCLQGYSSVHLFLPQEVSCFNTLILFSLKWHPKPRSLNRQIAEHAEVWSNISFYITTTCWKWYNVANSFTFF